MRKLYVALFISVLTAPLAPDVQAGFLEDLFGFRQQPAPEKTPRLPVMEVLPLLQEATCCKHGEDPMRALLNDGTLVRGDVVMTTHGLRTFVGSRPPHSMRDFVPVGKSTAISSERKRQLLALDR